MSLAVCVFDKTAIYLKDVCFEPVVGIVRIVNRSNFFALKMSEFIPKKSFTGSFSPLFYFKEKCCGNASFARKYLR